jgi:pimeloyl-ACP methyl ester carboxylesterase
MKYDKDIVFTFAIKNTMKKEAIFKGHKINYFVKGTGSAIVLIHGFTEHPGIWDAFSHELSKKYKVVCPALPAHGGSEFPTDLTMEFMADSIVAVLENEHISQAVFVGHSMGGYAMLNLAERYPHLCAGVCLFHSSGRADSPEVKQNRERAIEIISNNHGGFLQSFIPDLFAQKNRERLEDEINHLIEQSSTITSGGLIACMQAMKNRSGSIEFLALTSIPVGFILGKQDSRIQFEAVLAQAALPKYSQILILGDCGHMGYLEKYDETLQFAQHFIEYCNSITLGVVS